MKPHATSTICKRATIWLAVICMAAHTASAQRTDKFTDAQKKAGQALDLVNNFLEAYKRFKDFFNSPKGSVQDFNKYVNVVSGRSTLNDLKMSKKQDYPKFKDDKCTNMKWHGEIFFKDIFPSSLISMATNTQDTTAIFAAITRQLSIIIEDVKSPMIIRWEIECSDKRFLDKVSDTYYFTPKDGTFATSISPVLPWNYDALLENNSSQPITITFRIFDKDGHSLHKSFPISLRSINDCVWGYKDKSLLYLLAAYVQEENSTIESILRAAADAAGLKDGWIGYNGNNPEDVDRQVKALWRELMERNFTYNTTVPAWEDTASAYCQSVRTFDKVFKTNQANCLDGTVVFCSLLKRISIDPVLVLTEGHCLLGYYNRPHKKPENLQLLETTLMSKPPSGLKNATEKQKVDAYSKLFNQAKSEGWKTYDMMVLDTSSLVQRKKDEKKVSVLGGNAGRPVAQEEKEEKQQKEEKEYIVLSPRVAQVIKDANELKFFDEGKQDVTDQKENNESNSVEKKVQPAWALIDISEFRRLVKPLPERHPK